MQNFFFILIIVVQLHLSATVTPGTVVKNPDQPQKGQWDFKQEKVWDIDTIGNDVLAQLRRMKADGEGNLYIYMNISKKDSMCWTRMENCYIPSAKEEKAPGSSR